MLNMYSGYYMFIGFVRTCNTIQLGYKYLISKIQSVSNIGKCLQVDTTTTVHPSMRSFRKPQTAASFVPKACKTQARKKASQKRSVRNPSTWCRNCWQRIRKGQTPLQAELGQAKNDAFATLPHGAETAASKP